MRSEIDQISLQILTNSVHKVFISLHCIQISWYYDSWKYDNSAEVAGDLAKIIHMSVHFFIVYFIRIKIHRNKETALLIMHIIMFIKWWSWFNDFVVVNYCILKILYQSTVTYFKNNVQGADNCWKTGRLHCFVCLFSLKIFSL